MAAALLFGAFIYFCVRLFPKSKTRRPEWDVDKKVRNTLYWICGTGMALALGLAVWEGRRGNPIFWHETIALKLFALSWLVKGRADQTAGRLVKRTGHYAMHPREAIGGLRKAVRGKE